MKFIIVFAAFLAFVVARPNVEIVRSESDVEPEGFKFDVETSDGTSHKAAGHLDHAGSENEALSVQGSYSFVADDGHTYTVNYVADENGYQPTGAHLPITPPKSSSRN